MGKLTKLKNGIIFSIYTIFFFIIVLICYLFVLAIELYRLFIIYSTFSSGFSVDGLNYIIFVAGQIIIPPIIIFTILQMIVSGFEKKLAYNKSIIILGFIQIFMIISILACIYFGLKFYTEKYNIYGLYEKIFFIYNNWGIVFQLTIITIIYFFSTQVKKILN